MKWTETPLGAGVLVLDVENRPLSYWYDDKSTDDVTIAAWMWAGQKRIHYAAVGANVSGPEGIVEKLRPYYAGAAAVIAHNGTHDLGLLQGVCVEQSLPPLGSKLLIDTYRRLPNWKGIPKNLEYLLDLWGCPIEKPRLSQHQWRQANRVSKKEAIAVAVNRCKKDVLGTEWLACEERRRSELGLLTLRPAKRWSP